MKKTSVEYSKSTTYFTIKLLAESGEIQGLNLNKYMEILEIFEAPQEQEMLFLVLFGLEQALQVVRNISAVGWWKESRQELLEIEPVCRILLENKKKIMAYANERKELRKLDLQISKKTRYVTRNNSFRGLIGEHPLWSTLGHEAPHENLSPQFSQLLAHTLISLLILRHHPAQAHLTKSLDSAFSVIRMLANSSKICRQELDPLPLKVMNPDVYLNELSKITGEFRIHSIANLLKDAYRMTPDGEEADTDDNEELAINNIKFVKPPEEDQNTEDETSGGYDVIIGRRASFPADFFTGKQIAHAQAKANQIYPGSWSALSQHDAIQLLKWMTSLTSHKLSPNDVEGAALIHLMFWFSLNEHRLSTIVYGQQGDVQFETIDSYDPLAGTITLYSPYPRLKSPIDELEATQVYSRQSWIRLEVPIECRNALNRHMELSETVVGNPIFKMSPRLIVRRCRKILKQNLSKIRLPIKAVQKFFYETAARITNPVSAALMLGRDSALVRSKVHYQCSNHLMLENLYLTTCQHVRKLVPQPEDGTVPLPYTLLENSYLGTPNRPFKRTVINLFEKLSAELNNFREQRPQIKTLDDLVAYHNLYTLHSIMSWKFASGLRAVIHPYINQNSYDELSGFCILRDKDTKDGYHTRLVWLPDVCRNQLRHYRIYRDMFTANCQRQNINPEQFDKLPVFFLRNSLEELTIESITPSSLEEKLKQHQYYAPANAQRSFLRSELIERGCAHDVIELFLGHWVHGEEGFSASSSVHPEDYRASLKTYLPTLMKEIGIKAIKCVPSLNIDFKLERVVATVPRQSRLDKFLDLPDNMDPHAIWHEAKGTLFQEMDKFKAFNVYDKDLLAKVAINLPSLYSGELLNQPVVDWSLEQNKINIFFEKTLVKERTPQAVYKQQRLFFLVLDLLKNKYGLPIMVPTPPRLSIREKNLIKADMGVDFKLYRKLEKAFCLDIDMGIPHSAILRTGQILLSGILYGGLLKRSWMERVPESLAKRLYREAEWLWLDLWTVEPHENQIVRVRQQGQPKFFRRWISDTTSQLLICLWFRDDPDFQNKVCPDAIVALKSYLQHLGFSQITLKKHKARKKSNSRRLERPRMYNTGELTDLRLRLKHPRQAPITVNQVIHSAYAMTLTRMPAFLVAYARDINSSASLPDERWLYAIGGHTIPIEKHSTFPMQEPPDFAPTNFLCSYQKILRQELCETIQPANSDPEEQPETVIARIQLFIEDHLNNMVPVLYLLAQWALYLLSVRDSPLDPHRQKEPLAKSTVRTYITNIADLLIDECADQNPLHFNEEELTALYQKVVSTEQTSHREEKYKSKKIDIESPISRRVYFFHSFLIIVHEAQPFPLPTKETSSVGGVSAHFLTEQTYFRCLEALNWRSSNLNRHEINMIIMLIFGYRLSFRCRESLGSRLKDILGDDDFEICIRPHRQRKTKSPSATRSAVLRNHLPPLEYDFIQRHVVRRRNEFKVTSDDFLMTLSELHNQMISDAQIMVPLRDLIKKACCDLLAVYHHTRHSFLINLIIALLWRKDIKLQEIPFFMKGMTPPNPKLINRIKATKCTGRGDLYVAAIMIGHADVATGLYSYFHLCDWFLAYVMRHESSSPHLSQKAYARLMSCSTKNVSYYYKTQKYPFAGALVALLDELPASCRHPALSNALPTPPPINLSKEVNPRIPHFDQVYNQVKQDVAAKKYKLKLPRTPQDMEQLQGWYAAWRIKGTKTCIKAKRLSEWFFEISSDKGCVQVHSIPDLNQLLNFLVESEFDLKTLQAIFVPGEFASTQSREQRLDLWKLRTPNINWMPLHDNIQLPENSKGHVLLDSIQTNRKATSTPLSLMRVLAACMKTWSLTE